MRFSRGCGRFAVWDHGSSKQRRLQRSLDPRLRSSAVRHGCRGSGCVGVGLRCACLSEGPVDRGGLQAAVAARRRGSTRLCGTGRAPCGLVVRRSGRESRGNLHRVAAHRQLGKAPTFAGPASGLVGQIGRASPESRGQRSPPPRSSSATGREAYRGSAASRSPRARDTTRPMRFAHRLRGRSPRPSRRAASVHSKAVQRATADRTHVVFAATTNRRPTLARSWWPRSLGEGCLFERRDKLSDL